MSQSQLERFKAGGLLQGEERLRELVDHLRGVFLETDEGGNLSFLNRAGLGSTGYSIEDLRHGLNAFNVIAPENLERVPEDMQRLMNGERLGLTEYTVVRRDGTRYPTGIRASPVIRHGKPVSVRGLAM